MTYWGWDYAWWRPSNKQLKDNGVQFVCRYLSYDTTGKNLTKSEYQNLLKQGVAVVLNWEYATDAALGGKAQGVKDAKAAEAQRKAIGAPAAPIYFSCDWDATPGQQAAINAYLDGCASVIGRDRVGVYGSYYVVKRSMEAGKAKWGWCTYAWSGGQVYSKAHIYQYQNGVMGGQADRNRSLQDNFGQIKPGGTVANTNGASWMSDASDFLAVFKAALKNGDVQKLIAEAVLNTDGVVEDPNTIPLYTQDKDNPQWRQKAVGQNTYKMVKALYERPANQGTTVTLDKAELTSILQSLMAEAMTEALGNVNLEVKTNGK
jgi:hypothetical protein